MKTLLSMMFIAMMATTALAVVDPEDNKLGFYFDLNADLSYFDAMLAHPFQVYLMVTNPTYPNLAGYECHYAVEVPQGMESLVFVLSDDFDGPWHIGPPPQSTLDRDVRIVWPDPRPTTPAFVAGQMTMMLLGEFGTHLNLYAHSDPSVAGDRPAIMLPDESLETWLPVDVTRIDPGTIGCPCPTDPCASAFINAPCTVADEKTTWGFIKAVFR